MEYVSLIISLLAIMISGYSVYDTRRSNRIGHVPALIGHESESQTGYSYLIKNKGNGPAYFERVEYFYDSRPIEKSFREAVHEALTTNGVRFESKITNLGQKTIMGAGEEILLGKITFPAEDVEKFRKMRVFDIRIFYKSGYGEHKVWATDDRLESI